MSTINCDDCEQEYENGHGDPDHAVFCSFRLSSSVAQRQCMQSITEHTITDQQEASLSAFEQSDDEQFATRQAEVAAEIQAGGTVITETET